MAITWTKQDLAKYDIDSNYGDGWGVVSISQDGLTICVASSAESLIYASYDAGLTWEQLTTPPEYGTPQVAAPSNSGNIYLCSGNGVYLNWVMIYDRDTKEYTAVQPAGHNLGLYESYNQIHCSSDGRYIIVRADAASGGGNERCVFVSRDYGLTWNAYVQHASYSTCIIMVTSISSDGSKMSVLTRNVYVSGVTYQQIQVSIDYGYTWNLVLDEPYTNFYLAYTMANDDTFSNMVVFGSLSGAPSYAFGCFTTHDGGANWSKIIIIASPGGNVLGFGSMSMDASCAFVACGTKGTYKSLNSGDSWSSKTFTIGNLTYPPFFSGSSSSIVYAVVGGSNPIFKSLDQGETWGNIYPYIGFQKKSKYEVAIDSSGTIKLAGDYNNGYVYVNNPISGSPWAEISPSTNPSIQGWSTVCVSSDGSYMLAGENGGRIYLSHTSGSTWNEIFPTGSPYDGDWYGSAMSSDGRYIIVGEYSYDNLYLSSDYGISWSLASEGLGFTDNLACSADGRFMIGGGWEGCIFPLTMAFHGRRLLLVEI